MSTQMVLTSVVILSWISTSCVCTVSSSSSFHSAKGIAHFGYLLYTYLQYYVHVYSTASTFRSTALCCFRWNVHQRKLEASFL